jgi:homoserine dehydrogenase
VASNVDIVIAGEAFPTTLMQDERVRLSVTPEELALDHPLASAHGTEKAITYETDTMGRVTVMGGRSSPPGAAAALPKDTINLSRATGRTP